MKKAFVIDNNQEFIGFLKRQFSLLDIDLYIDYEEVNEINTYDYIIINNMNDINTNVENLNCNYCLVNMDMKINNISFKGNLITYGLGNKNTITLSSMAEDKGSFVYCIQRYITKDVEPGEIPITKNFKDNYELYAFMVSITIALIEGVSIEKIYKF